MLEAIAQRKRLSGRPYEDEITSAIFSPLQYFSAEETWSLLFDLLNRPKQLSKFMPNRLIVEFWPSKVTNYYSRECKVEPDVLFTAIDSKDTSVQVILEIKWTDDASRSTPLSSKDPLGNHDQLARQWNAFGHDNAWHLFMTLEPMCIEVVECQKSFAKAHSEKDCISWMQRFRHVTWHKIGGLCEKWAKHNSTIIGQWANTVRNALERLGIRHFHGFQLLQKDLRLIFEKPAPLFRNLLGKTNSYSKNAHILTTDDFYWFFSIEGGEYEKVQ